MDSIDIPENLADYVREGRTARDIRMLRIGLILGSTLEPDVVLNVIDILNKESEEEMEQKIYPCSCGGDVEITKRTHSSGMDGSYENWEFNCKKCGGSWEWAADNFYGRQSYTKDEVIDIWNKTHPDKESEG